ncbi:MAG: 6-pyruvoyl tetrahydropterin synthase family protein [Thermoplasmatales archaeon]|nr:6-pyruvoyl tetrahydropterin synthase family protein [Thermoplasmatales archaeon]
MSTSVEIDGWKSDIRFSSSHLLSGHKKCRFLHGHTYAIHSHVYGEKDEQGFIVDFSLLKSILREIADKLDHRILIPEKNESVAVAKKEIRINVDDKNYVFPREDCILLPIKSATAENLAEYILERLLKKMDLPKNVKKIDIGVDEGFGQGAWAEKIVG